MKVRFTFSLSVIFFLLFFLSMSRTSTAQSFITTWNTANPGVSNGTSITIPTAGAGYSYDVDWDNDGTFDELGIVGEVTHDFGVAGIYTIRIQGDFPRIYFNNNGDRLKLVSIDQWGSINWINFQDAFYGCENLNYAATDAPDLSNVTNLSGMFRLSGISLGDFSNWQLSNVTDMSFMFSFANQFDADISNWDVSSVGNFRGTFWGATQFNQPLNTWNVTSGKDMSFMFFQASAFNQDLDDWDVGDVTNMASMFSTALTFNGKIGTWDVNHVTDLSFMFFGATAFDQNLGNWPINNVTDMTNMLSSTALSIDHYDQTLMGWEAQAPPANITLGATGLKYCEATNARNSLIAAYSWTIDGDLQDCPFFTTTWQTNNPGTSNNTSITIPTYGQGYDYDVDWNNDGVFDEFGITGNITHDFGIPGVYTIKIKGNFPRIYFNDAGDKLKLVDISQWGDLQWESMASAFRGCANLGYSASDIPDLSNVMNMDSMFQGATGFIGNIGSWDVSTITTMAGLFRDAISFNQSLATWDMSSVTNMAGMFERALNFNQDLSSWEVSNVIHMSHMFDEAIAFNRDLSSWDVSSVTNMSHLFNQAFAFDQNLGGWNISSVTNMSQMLSNSGLSTYNYDQTLIGWEAQNVQSGVTLGADNLTYCEGEAARSALQNNDSWTIIGDEKSCPFITTWKTDNPGASPNDAITIPTIGGGYNYDIDWNNDGVYDQLGVNGSVSGIFPQPGTYTIRIRGDFPRIYFNNEGDKDKIINIEQWGDIEWTNMSYAFTGCTNLSCDAIDAPNLSNVSEMYSMFEECSTLNADLNHWEVSNVNNMSRMFVLATLFNQDLDEWDVSNVNNMNTMFAGAINFDGDISTWEVSNVLNMADMFHSASSFNGDLSNWDVSSVSTMSGMFNSAVAFNADISLWEVSNVGIFGGMLFLAISFDQNLGDWDLSSALSLQDMFDLSGLSMENYDNTLIGWAAQDVPQDLTLGATGLIYCAGRDARKHLIDEHNWTFDGDQSGCAPFITTWKTDNPGTSGDNAIVIPTTGDGYNYDVDWNNDGIYDQFGITGISGHIYPAPGTYTIRIKGDFPRIHFNNGGDKNKIINIEQWGEIEWETMKSAFNGCSNLNVTATDAPDLSNVTDLSSMFNSCPSFNAAIDHWDVSTITNMQQMFIGASLFNQDLNSWDVSNVTNMSYMFTTTDVFNGDISSWDVSNVVDMEGMFVHAHQFNSNLNNWDVSNVTNMHELFSSAYAFNSDLDNWEVSNVTNMNRMFAFANSFNGDISTWDVSNVVDMSIMFVNASSFNQALDNWDVSNVTTMASMFDGASAFNSDLSNWEVSNVTQMQLMFREASSFNSDLSNWDVSNVFLMKSMFEEAFAFDQSLGSWDLSSAPNMDNMLDDSGISQANYDNTLIGWAAQDVPQNLSLGALNLTYCAGRNARKYLIDEHNWTFEGDQNGCVPLITTWKTDNPGTSGDNAIVIPVIGDGYDYDVDWDNDGIYDEFGITGIAEHIYPAPGTYTIRIRGDFPRIYFNNAGDRRKITDIKSWGEIQWQSMENAFYGCNHLNISAVDAPDLSQVVNMSRMFSSCHVLNADINHWDVSNVMDMSNLFLQAYDFNQDLDQWDVSNVTNMAGMFGLAHAFNGEVSTWDVSNVESMSSMFEHASVFSGDLSSWNVSNVTSMVGMFNNAHDFNLPINNWDVSNVTNMNSMFVAANSFNQDLSLWDVSNVTIMESMFHSAESFDQDLGDWNITSVTNMEDMLDECGLSQTNYDNTLIAWAIQDVQQNVSLGALNLLYCEGQDARTFLINQKGWIIEGDTRGCAPFITTWKTDNPGISDDNAIVIPTIGDGYNYDVDWDNDGIYDQFGITGIAGHIYPAPGTYTIRIRGDFPRIYFNGEGDAKKIINIDQWGEIEWTSMNAAFRGCSNLDAKATDIPDLSNVTDLSSMFNGCTVFNGEVSNWDVSNVTDMSALFRGAEEFNQDLNNWDVSNVTDMSNLFTAASVFNGNISTWDVSSVTDMSYLFAFCQVFNGDLSSWDVSSVTDMQWMFTGSFAFNSDLSSWDVSNVTEMKVMFWNAQAFNSNLNAWEVSNVTDMSSMFWNAHAFNGNVSAWDVSNVTNMNKMFQDAYTFNGDLSNWDVSNVVDFGFTFCRANAFNSNIGNWDVSSAEDMSYMFWENESFNTDLSSWDVSSVTDMKKMFDDALLFDQDLGYWDISQVEDMEEMLSNCGMSIDNYDNTLIGWANQNVQPNVGLGAEGLLYCAGEAARTNLVDNSNWSITGDQYDCAVLPVELLGFDARANSSNEVEVYWATATEIDNDYFIVERSKDGLQFEVVAQVEGSGNSSTPKNYSTLDQRPYTGVSYYRLQQVDFDGTTTYSNIVSVEIATATTIKLFPNPVMEVLNIRFPDNVKGKIQIQVYNGIGQLMIEKQFAEDEASSLLSLDEVANFDAGVYHIKASIGREVFARTFVKSKD